MITKTGSINNLTIFIKHLKDESKLLIEQNIDYMNFQKKLLYRDRLHSNSFLGNHKSLLTINNKSFGSFCQHKTKG